MLFSCCYYIYLIILLLSYVYCLNINISSLCCLYFEIIFSKASLIISFHSCCINHVFNNHTLWKSFPLYLCVRCTAIIYINHFHSLLHLYLCFHLSVIRFWSVTSFVYIPRFSVSHLKREATKDIRSECSNPIHECSNLAKNLFQLSLFAHFLLHNFSLHCFKNNERWDETRQYIPYIQKEYCLFSHNISNIFKHSWLKPCAFMWARSLLTLPR